MEITNVTTGKEIFTAKTDNGFVGCFRVSQGVFFTGEVFEKAFSAANAARKLRKELGGPATESTVPVQKPKKLAKLEKAKKPEVKKEKSSQVKPKKLLFVGKIYTLEETMELPMLSFHEVWIIRHGEDYVADAMNHDRKKLVEYSNSKHTAMRFDDHEKAKRIMRVLKGTVGPGFDLQRFFVRLD